MESSSTKWDGRRKSKLHASCNRIPLAFRRSGTILRPACRQQDSQYIYKNRDVNKQEGKLDDGKPANDLVKLQRDETAGDDHREIFAPTLPQQQACPFTKVERSIKKCAYTDRRQLPGSHRERFCQ